MSKREVLRGTKIIIVIWCKISQIEIIGECVSRVQLELRVQYIHEHRLKP